MDENLLDAIYEAAIMVNRWPAVLDTIARKHGARGGALFARRNADVQWVASDSIRLDYEAFLELGWHTRNARVDRGRSMNHPGFITDTDMFTEAEMAGIPIYRDYFVPRGLGAGVGAFMPGVQDDELVLTLEGFANHTDARASLPSLDCLRPHLARAGMLAARLQLERARVAVETLALVGTPAAMLGAGRRILAANDMFIARMPGIGQDTPTGLRLADPCADATMGKVLADLGKTGARGASLPVLSQPHERCVLHILPIKGEARDLMLGATAALVLATPKEGLAPELGLIRSLLDLTPAEAKLAQALAGTGELAAAAMRLKISPTTARTQLKSVFAKTGLKRQSQLLLLLRDMAHPN